MAPIKKRTPIRARAHAAKSPRDAISHPRSTYLPSTSDPDDTTTTASRAGTAQGMRPNKKQKAELKHKSLLEKVRDGGVGKNRAGGEGGGRRRRPGRKIAAVESLGGLGDALPLLQEGEEEDDEWEGLSGSSADGNEDLEVGKGGGEGGDGDVSALPAGMRKARRRRRGGAEGEGKVVMKSLRHRPGAMKRKRDLELKEVARMRGNLVQMAKRVPQGETTRVVGKETRGGGEDDRDDGQHGGQGVSQAERWKALRAFIGGTMEKSGEFAGKKA